MNIYELYTFYIENCIDEDKSEIPLNFNEWVENHGQQELENTKLLITKNRQIHRCTRHSPK